MPMLQGCRDEAEINLIKMMQPATNFVGEGGGLTDFRIQAAYETGFGSQSMNGIVQALKTSTSTLQNLYFRPEMEMDGDNSSDIWEMASSCPRLVSSFSYFDDFDFEHEGNLPDRLNKDNLKYLGFICDLNFTDWSIIRTWIGGHLEKFNLIAETSRRDLQLCSPHSPMSIILDSRESLKVLELELCPFLASDRELQIPLSFPNLKSLSLEVEGEIGQWFSKLDLPKLHTLCLKTRNFQRFNSKNDTGFFYSLLENHSSKLTNLAFHDSLRTEHKFILADVPKLSFVKLTHLHLGQCSESHKSWFSRFLYPNLFSFSKSQDSAPFWPKVSEDETMGDRVQWKQKDDSNLWERCKKT